MARPVRRLWKMRRMVRRRHRTWMASMCFAALGWGTWWLSLLIVLVAPGLSIGIEATSQIGGIFAAFGFAAALITLRAKLAWIIITMVPLMANASLVILPLTLYWMGPDGRADVLESLGAEIERSESEAR